MGNSSYKETLLLKGSLIEIEQKLGQIKEEIKNAVNNSILEETRRRSETTSREPLFTYKTILPEEKAFEVVYNKVMEHFVPKPDVLIQEVKKAYGVMQKICSNCGAKLPAIARFYGVCGAKLET